MSDTHGLLRAELLQGFAGCSVILHAGDVGRPDVLHGLRQVAPVVAVRGNVDHGSWAWQLPWTEVVEVEQAHLYMIHDLSRLDLDPAAAGFQAVISGHSHKPETRNEGGVLYINPGSAGPRRLRWPVSAALLHVTGADLEVEWLEFRG